jgi:hypothetical protein
MTPSKPSWQKTNVRWEIRKLIWQRWALGDKVPNTLTFFDLHKGEKGYKDVPTDRSTIIKIRGELAHVPLELLHKLLEELPEVKSFLYDQRPDFKQINESLQQPQSHPSFTVIPKRKIKSQTIETKIVNGKNEVTHKIEIE